MMEYLTGTEIRTELERLGLTEPEEIKAYGREYQSYVELNYN